MISRLLVIFSILLLAIACKDNAGTPEPVTVPDNDLPLDYLSLDKTPAADIELLFIGNSHSAAYGLSTMVASLIETGTNQTANGFKERQSRFLADRSFDGETQDAIKSRPWTHVILQAQKYSSTGNYSYPTVAAEEWIRIIKQQNARPIMFPEHPRAGNFEEGLRIHTLHFEIAQREPACVSPVGLAWDLALTRYPRLELHLSDGNHANLQGVLLTAFVFYQVITEQPANQLPYIASIDIDESVQSQLKQVATEAVVLNPPCLFYP